MKNNQYIIFKAVKYILVKENKLHNARNQREQAVIQNKLFEAE